MNKSTVLQCVVVTLVVALAMGCATGVKGPSDEELVTGALATWEAGIMEEDMDKILSTYSDDFSHSGMDYDAADKDALRGFIEDSIEIGYFEDVEISYDASGIQIEGDTAVVYPIDYSIVEGTVTIGLTLKKEKGGWLVTDMEIEGL